MTTNLTLDDLLSEANWLELRESALTPTDVSELVTTEQTRREFVEGSRLLRLDRPGVAVMPHQLLVADVMNAGKEATGILLPRRSSKTTSILAVVLGRCRVREDYVAVMTLLTKASTTSARFRADVIAPITRRWPDKKERPIKVGLGKGDEHLEFPNGSFFAAYSPNPDSFRSGGFDLVLADESGEAEPEQGSDIQDAILPTLDSKPEGQVIYAGTAARYRKGNLLFDTLNDPDAARLIYAAPDTTSENELAAWEPTADAPEGHARELIELAHPGVAAGLTTIEKMEVRYRKLGPEAFAREYLSIFGTGSAGTAVLDLDAWKLAGDDDELPPVPDHFGFAFVTHPLERTACLAIAWRDEDDTAHLGVVRHQRGTGWITEEAYGVARRRKVGIAWDRGPLNASRREAENLERANPAPRLFPQDTNDVKVAASRLADDLKAGKVKHYNDPGLNAAVEQAVKRKIGVGHGWGFGPADTDADITPLEAASYALHSYDTQHKPQKAFSYVVT
jgi:hypothetical protein